MSQRKLKVKCDKCGAEVFVAYLVREKGKVVQICYKCVKKQEAEE